jgi:hypothetical protein
LKFFKWSIKISAKADVGEEHIHENVIIDNVPSAQETEFENKNFI